MEGVFTFINKAGRRVVGIQQSEEVIVGTKVKNICGSGKTGEDFMRNSDKDGV